MNRDGMRWSTRGRGPVMVAAMLGLAAAGAGAETVRLEVPILDQNRRPADLAPGEDYPRRNLCAPTVAEMILRHHGHRPPSNRRDVAYGCWKLMKQYRRSGRSASWRPQPLDFEWPDYRETYQTILRDWFRGQGYEVVNRRTDHDPAERRRRFDELLESLRHGLPVLFHVPGHYMLAIGFDTARGGTLTYADPNGGQVKSCRFSQFLDADYSFGRTDSRGRPRGGWTSRTMIVKPRAGSGRKRLPPSGARPAARPARVTGRGRSPGVRRPPR